MDRRIVEVEAQLEAYSKPWLDLEQQLQNFQTNVEQVNIRANAIGEVEDKMSALHAQTEKMGAGILGQIDRQVAQACKQQIAVM
jgi:hypothetical protein